MMSLKSPEQNKNTSYQLHVRQMFAFSTVTDVQDDAKNLQAQYLNFYHNCLRTKNSKYLISG